MGYWLESYGCGGRWTWKTMPRWKRKEWHRQNDLRRANGLPPMPKP